MVVSFINNYKKALFCSPLSLIPFTDFLETFARSPKHSFNLKKTPQKVLYNFVVEARSVNKKKLNLHVNFSEINESS